jgi:hypothetical protein
MPYFQVVDGDLDFPGDSPHESAQFSGDSRYNNLLWFSPGPQLSCSVNTAGPGLSMRCHKPFQAALPGDLGARDSTLAGKPIRPGGFGQNATHMGLPDFVIEPRRVFSPLECSDGTNPR